MTTSSNLLQEVDKILIATSKRAWEISGNTGEPLIPQLHELQDFTSPQVGSDLAVIVSKSGDRYYVIDREDTSLFLLERTQQLKELREAPSKQWDVIHRASIQQMASLILFSQCFEIDPSLPKVDHSNQQIQNIIKIFETMIETSDRDLEGPRPFIPSEQRQDFEQQIQRELKQLKIESQHQAETLAAFWSGELSADHLNAISNFMIETRGEPTPERLLWLMTTWAGKKELPNPLIPLVTAWQQAKTAKRLTPEFDHKHPFGILKHPMGTVREVRFVESTGNLREFVTPDRISQIETPQQFFDFAKELPSLLPKTMALEIAYPLGIKTTTRPGAVHPALRIFHEIQMGVKPKETCLKIGCQLRYIINALYPSYLLPTGERNPKTKFNRTNQLKYIIEALHYLHNDATVRFRENGKIRPWRPIVVQSPVTIDLEDDDWIYFFVDFPDDATQGMMVVRQIMRQLGFKSASQWNLYLTACGIWDKYGTTRDYGLIDPTRPDHKNRRDADLNLLKADGSPYLDSRGKPITDPLHPDVVAQLDRTDNKRQAIERYPVLSDSDKILAVSPSGYDPKRKKQELTRAETHWVKLEQKGVIKIDRTPEEGWRLMPGEKHVKGYRGLKRAIEKSNKK